jgi:hypothetical protein
LTATVLFTLFAAASSPAPAQGEPIVDRSWLAGSHWDDGLAEIAFYQVERSLNQYGRTQEQSFLVGTYLVKHDFDPLAQAKAGNGAQKKVSAFKWALFYEFTNGALQYKRAYVTNAAQADLEPLKASFTSFDWCSNLYREMAFLEDGTIEGLMRSDDYGNRTVRFTQRPNAYPVAELPLLVRGLDFSDRRRIDFELVLADGQFVKAHAELLGREALSTPAGQHQAEKIAVRHEGEVPSPVGERADAVEYYWRDTEPGRLLLKLEAESGRYRMTLVEALRSAYWRENFFPRLKQVHSRP